MLKTLFWKKILKLNKVSKSMFLYYKIQIVRVLHVFFKIKSKCWLYVKWLI